MAASLRARSEELLNPVVGSPMVGSSVSGPRRVMIVGDVALSRTLMKMVLTRLGYVVTCVASGGEALTALSHTRFALSLIALHLPDLPGMALAHRLRDTPGPVGTMPIVLFGDAWDQEAVLEGCREARIEGYLPKPISIARLVSSVCDLVRRAAQTNGGAPSMPHAEPVQAERLREFTDGDAQLERELTSLYLSTATLYLDEMRGSFGNAEDWTRTAHALKGASANIGAVEVARLAAEAERAGPTPTRLAGLEDALEDVRRFFRERAANRPPSPALAAARTS